MASSFSARKSMSRSVSFLIHGTVDTRITVSENADGTLTFDLAVLGSGSIGDLRGLFFDVACPSKLGHVRVSGHDVTGFLAKNDAVDTLGGDASVQGAVSSASNKFDVGIAFGTPGITKDDIQATSFTLSGLSIDDIGQQDFALRYTSVGAAGGKRTGDVKILGHSSAVPNAINTAPNAINDSFSTDENTALANANANVLLNDTDADGDPLAVSAINS